MKPAEIEHPTVFFDGVCGICNRFVDFLLKADSKAVLRFAPLQGETAERLLPQLPRDEGEWAVVYVDRGRTSTESDAVFEILRKLGGFWALPGLGRWLPRALRNAGYRFVARRRYRWFGRRDACRIPSPEERARFLP